MTASPAAATGGAVLQIPSTSVGWPSRTTSRVPPKDLKLDGPTLAGIFDGKITNWNAPQIAEVTADSSLPDLPIVAVHRADSSGPGYDLDQYLIDTPSAWSAPSGTQGVDIDWPVTDHRRGRATEHRRGHRRRRQTGAIGFSRVRLRLQTDVHQRGPEEQVRDLRGPFVQPSPTPGTRPPT